MAAEEKNITEEHIETGKKQNNEFQRPENWVEDSLWISQKFEPLPVAFFFLASKKTNSSIKPFKKVLKFSFGNLLSCLVSIVKVATLYPELRLLFEKVVLGWCEKFSEKDKLRIFKQ